MIKSIKKKLINLFIIIIAFNTIFTLTGCNDKNELPDTNSYKAWCNNWITESTDKTFISITPGSDESRLNFAWYSKKSFTNPQVKISKNLDMSDAVIFSGNSSNAIQNYNSNKVTVSNLKPSTVYYYACGNNNRFGKINKIKTQSNNNFSFIFTGDPQIGASAKKNSKSSQYNVCEKDSYNWNKNLNQAIEIAPNASFIISAGDQIQSRNLSNYKSQQEIYAANEIEYSGFLCASALKNIPIATAIGNHDANACNYSYHFNNPNAGNLGSTAAGGDYYFNYGNALFIFLNANNTSEGEHSIFIKKAISASKNAKWKIVVMHQDIYGSGKHSNEPDNIILRYKLNRIFEKYKIDVVLSGHDHSYSRSEILKGGHIEPKALITQENYNAYMSGNLLKDKKFNEYIDTINDRNAIAKVNKQENDDEITVTNPNGILYITEGSSTGSKYYKTQTKQPAYIAKSWQKNAPTFSVISIKHNSFSIITYRADTTETIDKTYTIMKK